MAKINLLQETVEILHSHDKTPEAVRWVGSKDGKYAVTWEEFSRFADCVYDRDYNKQYVARDLVVVGDNWWLERKEYEGAEWWIFLQFPQAKAANAFSTVFIDKDDRGWLTIEQIKRHQKIYEEVR